MIKTCEYMDMMIYILDYVFNENFYDDDDDNDFYYDDSDDNEDDVNLSSSQVTAATTAGAPVEPTLVATHVPPHYYHYCHYCRVIQRDC